MRRPGQSEAHPRHGVIGQHFQFFVLLLCERGTERSVHSMDVATSLSLPCPAKHNHVHARHGALIRYQPDKWPACHLLAATNSREALIPGSRGAALRLKALECTLGRNRNVAVGTTARRCDNWHVRSPVQGATCVHAAMTFWAAPAARQ
jgi:hypothetical protein